MNSSLCEDDGRSPHSHLLVRLAISTQILDITPVSLGCSVEAMPQRYAVALYRDLHHYRSPLLAMGRFLNAEINKWGGSE